MQRHPLTDMAKRNPAAARAKLKTAFARHKTRARVAVALGLGKSALSRILNEIESANLEDPRGERESTELDYEAIGKRICAGDSLSGIATDYGVSRSYVARLKARGSFGEAARLVETKRGPRPRLGGT